MTRRHALRAGAALAGTLLAAALGAAPGTAAAQAGTPAGANAWVEKSNAITHEVLAAQGRLYPEFASQQGLAQFDGLTQDVGPGSDARALAAGERLLADLRRRLRSEADPDVRQDLQILIRSIGSDLEGVRLRARLELAWIDAPQFVFGGLSGLLDDQVAPARRTKALQLLQRYVGLLPGTTPLTQQARASFEQSRRPGRSGPLKRQVEQAIANVPTYAAGIRELFTRYGVAGPEAEAALAAMDRQFADYAAWQQRSVLPLTRTSVRMPEALYAFALRQAGIDIAPQDLIRQAQVAYLETRMAMQALAPQVAQARGFTATDYRDVIRQLKRETIPDEQLVARYQAVNDRIEAVVRRERIVTLPSRPMRMRLASPAESAAQPAPHMQPPALIGNTGQRGVFVLPVRTPGASADDSIDDFNFPAATWTMSAHEGRPGHELQFAAMVERGVSTARALYAFNSVNVEGWALYAEALMLPHEPPEGQLIALQFRLLRAARAMLDPMLNLGLMTPDEAARILREEVLLSPPMVRQEVDRYTFRNPGQAGTYFYGYTRLLQLRTETELALGPRFDALAFNDFLLGQGLLPPDALARVVREQFAAGRPAR